MKRNINAFKALIIICDLMIIFSVLIITDYSSFVRGLVLYPLIFGGLYFLNLLAYESINK